MAAETNDAFVGLMRDRHKSHRHQPDRTDHAGQPDESVEGPQGMRKPCHGKPHLYQALALHVNAVPVGSCASLTPVVLPPWQAIMLLQGTVEGVIDDS